MDIIGTYYLIDYENVGVGGLAGVERLGGEDHIYLFYTDNNKKIDLDVFFDHGEADIRPYKIPTGKQRLDMHLVSFLGYLLGKDGAVRWRQCKANSWSGGDFVRILNPVVKYCPYCNADTIYAVKICGRRVLPYASALDHFMPRSHFPYFGISLCNLVPSCTRCNSSLKGDSSVTFADAPHPYRDNLYGNFRFYVTAHSITSIGQDCDFDISVKYMGGMAQQNKAKHLFDDVLHIGDVYDQLFKRETLDIIKKLRLLTKPYIKGVFSGLLSSNNDLKCLLPELLVPNDCIPTYRFSKLTKDMAVQFGVMARALFGG